MARGNLVLDNEPDLLHRLNDVPVARPALGQHHGVARPAAPRRAIRVGEEEHALQHEEHLRLLLGAGPAAGRAGPVPGAGGADVVHRRTPLRGGAAVQRVLSHLELPHLGLQLCQRHDLRRLGGAGDVGVVQREPDLADALLDVPAAVPVLWQHHRVPRAKGVLCAIRVGDTAVAGQHIESLRSGARCGRVPAALSAGPGADGDGALLQRASKVLRSAPVGVLAWPLRRQLVHRKVRDRRM
mmetsp:Transcript_3304/g.8316  ORF Transcript_3304/g.8316 Transcript_3304/m.8316 type:complete len:241 (+) Transcript_3304:33-755(+)